MMRVAPQGPGTAGGGGYVATVGLARAAYTVLEATPSVCSKERLHQMSPLIRKQQTCLSKTQPSRRTNQSKTF